MDDLGTWLGEQFANILAVAALITGFIFYWLSRRPKRFGWQSISTLPIVRANTRNLPLKVVYDGQEVSSPNLIVLRLGNVGKAEIRASDFDGPVRIEFPKGQLLASSISATVPDDLQLELDTTVPNCVSFTPSLLNAGEWVDLRFVTDGPVYVPTVHARVAGQTSEMTDVAQRTKRIWLRVLLLGGVITFGPLIMGIILRDRSIWIVCSLFIGCSLMLLGLMKMDNKSSWKKKRKLKAART
jgi:hypothetical protein